ncbi:MULTISPECIES: SCO family protein [Salegentibacter]|jgi:protein SCO1/2|uniref:Protein SCO1/2 n=1 Tax=Salegentibacter agarivorans TaxID=345907 RepID=A0A1I2LXZ2_9FLAO|nr:MULTISPECIES: SCO family protein [Salegentibacter]APS38285.1 photosynthetic protein synthase II [Salegentibacter sp. T436]SFF84135.1 protein SCO1/2 [Salegentibacter agarivorans]|tara:strand:- start:295 stop:966 length:672 start_codon:yes stop_codon:yes gene_type:complete
MRDLFAWLKKFAIVLFILSVIIIYSIYTLLNPKERLPVFQPDMVNAELVDSTVQYVRKYHTVKDFKLINQNGDTITEDFYEDKIYVADFFFTTCLTICPVMTDHMLKIQEKIKDDPEVLLLSHTVFPKTDSVPVLKEYAIEKGVLDEKWNLVTGDKKHIYDLARKSYLASKSNGDGGPYDMIHTENFVLVDKEKRIRGFYDGTDAEAIEDLLHDIKVLKAEYK